LLFACSDDAPGAGGASSAGSGGAASADSSTGSSPTAGTGDSTSSQGGVGGTGATVTAASSSAAGGGGSGGEGGGGGGGANTTSGSGGAPSDAGALFTDTGLARIELTLTEGALDDLDAEPSTYVHGDARIVLASGDTLDLSDIGVRLKGRYGSFRTLDEKAAFLLRFDKFDPDQEPLGLEKLALNNLVQDPSMIHEQLAYALFRDAGVPAPRTGYARVYVNGDLFGLYATVEPADNSDFLDSAFGNDEGNLYEGEYGSDFFPGWGSSFDLDNGTDVDFADIESLADALDAMVTPDTFLEDADGVLEMDRYLQLAATEIFIGHWDGYAWTRNNYFVYSGADARWTFMPWGTDQTFFDYLPIWDGAGRIEQMCLQSLPCRQALASAFADVIDRVSTLDLIGRCDALQALIDDAMQEDPRKEYDADTVYWGIEMTKDFLANRPADVEAQFACTDPSRIDADGDGAPGCGIDCNDDDASVYPGAPELCNVFDDDCNGLLDDSPDCPPCVEVPASEGGTLSYCFQPLAFAEAESACTLQGGQLASIHDEAAQDEIVSGAYSLMGGLWWIGLSDRLTEGDFAWTDGTPVDFETWADGEPNDYDGAEDCAHLADWAGGAWNDIGCGAVLPFVCFRP